MASDEVWPRPHLVDGERLFDSYCWEVGNE